MWEQLRQIPLCIGGLLFGVKFNQELEQNVLHVIDYIWIIKY